MPNQGEFGWAYLVNTGSNKANKFRDAFLTKIDYLLLVYWCIQISR